MCQGVTYGEEKTHQVSVGVFPVICALYTQWQVWRLANFWERTEARNNHSNSLAGALGKCCCWNKPGLWGQGESLTSFSPGGRRLATKHRSSSIFSEKLSRPEVACDFSFQVFAILSFKGQAQGPPIYSWFYWFSRHELSSEKSVWALGSQHDHVHLEKILNSEWRKGFGGFGH